MNLNSREIRRLNIKWLVLIESLSALSTIFLFGCAVFGRLFTLHSFVYSFLYRSFSCYCLCSGHLSAILTSI